MTSVERLCTQLREHGRRVTPQRRAIIKALLDSAGVHPTADQVFKLVQVVMPDMSPATVYNTLHEMVEIGELLELDLGLGERRYDLYTDSHAHLVCLGCGRVMDVPFVEPPVLLPEHAPGFRVVEHNVIFRGYCAECSAKELERHGEKHKT